MKTNLFPCIIHHQHITIPLPHPIICKINDSTNISTPPMTVVVQMQNFSSSIRLKNPYSDRQHKKAKPKPITYSSPSPVYVTTSEAPQTLTNHPNVPLSYDYDEIPAQPTTPSPVEYHTVKVTTFAPDERYLQNLRASSVHKYHPQDLHELPVPEILTKLQKANHLPEHLTPDNADNSIKTLVKIFNDIKQTEVASKPPPPPPIYHNQADDDYDYANYGSADDGLFTES